MGTAPESPKLFGSRNDSVKDVPDKYPLAIRIYGVLSIGIGVISIGSFMLSVVSVILNGVDFSSMGRQTTTIVITSISLLLTVATSVLGILLGVRLLYGLRHRAALMANIMMIIESFDLVCQFMLFGVSYQLIPGAVNSAALNWLARDAAQSKCLWKVLLTGAPAAESDRTVLEQAGIHFVISDGAYSRSPALSGGQTAESYDEEARSSLRGDGVVYLACGDPAQHFRESGLVHFLHSLRDRNVYRRRPYVPCRACTFLHSREA